MRIPFRLPELGKFKPTLKSIPEEAPARPPRNPARETGGHTAEARRPMGFEDQRFAPPTRPGPQGHADISWPSAPVDGKGKPFDLRGADAYTGKPMAYDGPRIGTETGSPTYFQSNRNQLAAKKNEAHIAHLTFPKNRAYKKKYELAKHHEEQFTRAYSKNIKREIQAGHRDDAVPMQRVNPPSLKYRKEELPISGPLSGKPITGPANAKVPANPAMPRGRFPGLERYRNAPGAGPHQDPKAGDADAHYRKPLHLDRLVQMDDMVNAAATAHVNKPSRSTEKEYKQALSVRDKYESHNKKGIEAEKRSGAWSETPIIASHPDYRQLKIADGFVESKRPVAGTRVPGSSDASVPKEAPGVSAYAHEPDLKSLQGRLARLRGEGPQSARQVGMENPAPRRAGAESPIPRPGNPMGKIFDSRSEQAHETEDVQRMRQRLSTAHPGLPAAPPNSPAVSRAESPEPLRPLRTSRGTQTDGAEAMVSRGVQTGE